MPTVALFLQNENKHVTENNVNNVMYNVNIILKTVTRGTSSHFSHYEGFLERHRNVKPLCEELLNFLLWHLPLVMHTDTPLPH